MSSNTILVIVVTALVLGGGVVLGATLFTSGGAPEEPPRGVSALRTEEASAVPPPILRGEGQPADMAALEARLAAVEAELERLKASQEETREELEPVLRMAEMAEQLHGGDIDLDELGLEEARLLRQSGPGGAERIADLLALDPARRQAFEETHAALVEQLKELEAAHATVTENEDGLTIAVEAFPSDGARIEREWEDFVGRTLTPEEQERYRKHRLANPLFPHGFGQYARTITVKDMGGNLEVTEDAKGPDGQDFRTVTQGPAEARGMMLDPYMHLLK
ncbi:MAG: hypothetical protein ACYTG6_15995 [Planctomycetota bacterium]|jgi:hypothetical protein